MGSKGSPPATVDPYQSAAAQYQYGTAAADYNAGLNDVNTVTPYGSTTWTVNPGGIGTTPPSPGANSGKAAQGTPQQGGPGGVNGNWAGGGSIDPGGQPGMQHTSDGVPQPVQSTTQTGQFPRGVPPGAQSPPGYNFYGSMGINGPASAYGTPGSTAPATGGDALQANAGGTQYIPKATAPQYTQTQTLSPIEQQIFGETTGNQTQQLADYSQLLKGVPLSAPQLQTQVPGANNLPGEFSSAENTALKGNLAAITPTLNAQYEQLDAGLRNSGSTPGTPAYDTAMSQFMSGEGNELTQAGGAAVNTGLNVENTLFGQGVTGANFTNNALMSQYGLPFEGLSYLGSGSGGGGGSGTGPGSMTGFQLPGASGSGASVGTPDIMSAFQQAYQGQLANYNANVATSNATASDLAGLAGAAMIAFA